jgi:hypothetical protein
VLASSNGANAAGRDANVGLERPARMRPDGGHTEKMRACWRTGPGGWSMVLTFPGWMVCDRDPPGDFQKLGFANCSLRWVGWVAEKPWRRRQFTLSTWRNVDGLEPQTHWRASLRLSKHHAPNQINANTPSDTSNKQAGGPTPDRCAARMN